MSRARLVLFLAVTATLGVYLGLPFFQGRGGAKRRHLPGVSSDGHYQLELSCESCHTPFGGVEQKACVGCHGGELEAGKDSHAESKLADPRNADRLDALDARSCTTCHAEHERERTTRGGVSAPGDLCGVCHGGIAEERPSHAGLEPTSCATSGCHNFHDNRGLYESFLAQHLGEPALLPSAPPPPAPPAKAAPAEHDDCRGCHEKQAEGFGQGRHGMRHAAGLGLMRAGEARLPMRAEAAERTLDCSTCHDGHGTDLRKAATDACLGCHDDEHSRAFPATSHAAGGLTCASCHMPGGEHNQSANLRPTSKMGRDVCQSCHGLGLVLDARADEALFRKNFDGPPAVHVRSLEMVEERLKTTQKRKKEQR